MSSNAKRSMLSRFLFRSKPTNTIRYVTPRHRPHLITLEDRVVPQATLYVDFGDNLPLGGMTDTLGNLLAAKSGANPRVEGPDLVGFFGNASDLFTWSPYSSVYGSASTANRKVMMDYVRRFYEPFDMAVVELTSSPQTINGTSVTAAATLLDISETLGKNNSQNKNIDTYVMVGQWIANGFDMTDVLAGIASGKDLNGNAGGANNTEGSVIVCVSTQVTNPIVAQDNNFNGDTIAHEAGHNWGLGHVYPNYDNSLAAPGLNLVGQGEVMAYNRAVGVNGVDQMTNVTRFPSMRGNGVGDPTILAPTQFKVLTQADQLIADPSIGANPNLEFVTGTGANDRITITKTGVNSATVTVEAFNNNSYTSAIGVPGPNFLTQTVYSYNITLSPTKTILIDSGARDDLIILDASLGVNVRLRGGSGNDRLQINGTGNETVTYSVGSNKTNNPIDTAPDFRALIGIGSKTIDVTEFETTSNITINNVGDVTYITPGGIDKITATKLLTGETQITGTVAKTLAAIPLTMTGEKLLAFNLGNGDTVGAADDQLTISFVNGNPIPVNGMKYDGGLGKDKIIVSTDTNFTLSDTAVGLGALGTIALTSVEAATLTGGASNNNFTVSNWTGTAVLDGGIGKDTITFSQDANITLAPTLLTTSAGVSIQLVSFEAANLSGGASDNSFDLSAWSATASVNGLGGIDTLKLIRNADFTATDAQISVSDGTSYTVTSIELADLTGGAGNNLFDFNAWSGGGAVNGLGGTDDVRVTRDADITLSAGSLVISVGLPLSITSIENANLTGGASNNVFTLNGWNGNANLDGLNGADTYRITPGTKLSTINIADTGALGPVDAVEILGTSAADNYAIEPDAVVSGAQRVQFIGVESVLVDGKDGDDTFVSDINKGFFTGGSFILEGGLGLNTFVITGTPAKPIAQSGVLFTSSTDGKILLDPDGSITPSLVGTLTGDEIIVPFKNMSKIGDVTPAARFDFAFGNTSDTITVTDGGIFAGTPTVQVFDGVHGVSVARKTRVVVSGGGGTDSFSLDTTAAVPGITAFDLIGGNGLNTFTLKSANLPVGLFGGTTDDSFSLGSTTGLDAVTGSVTIDGGTGTNSVVLNDAASASANALVVIGSAGVGGLAGTGANLIAFAPGTISNLTVTGASGFANTVVLNSLGIPLTLTTGTKNDLLVLNAAGSPANIKTAAGADFVQINSLSAGLTLQTEDDNDTVTFNVASGTPGGTLDGFTTPFTFDGGAGPDTAIFNDAADATGNAYALSSSGLTRTGGVALSYTNVESAKLFGGTGDNTYDVTGLTGGVAVTDGIGNAKFTIAGDKLGGTNSFVGGAGNDSYTFTGEGIAAATTIDAGAGTDKAAARGTSGDNALIVGADASGGGSITGAGAGTLTYLGLESLGVDGLTGNNSLVYTDTATTSRSFAYVPNAATTGTVTGPAGTTKLNFTNANQSFSFAGSVARDTLTVYGVSTTGSGTGTETTAANGVDTVTVSDALVTIQNATLGNVRSVAITESAGVPTVKTLIVRTGNESSLSADQVTATPSNRSTIYIYGGTPTDVPGDKLVVNTSGPRTVLLDTDPQGKSIIRVTQLSNGATVGFADFETAPRPELVAVGSGPGSVNRVQVFDASSGIQKLDFSPFEQTFTGGLSVATGDVTGDLYPDIFVAAGPGGAPVVKVFEGLTGALIAEFSAYDSSFRGGVQVAAGDVNGDGVSDIIIGSGIGGAPHVQAVSGKDFNTRLMNFFAYDQSFRSGVQVSAGDVDGDGRVDIVTGAGPGGGPHIRAFSGKDGSVLANFFAFDPNFRGGVNVAVGDVNGDGKVDIIAAPGSNGGTTVYLYSLDGSLQTQFNATVGSGQILPFAREDGLRIAAADLDGDGVKDLITSRGRGTRPVITGYKLGSINGPTPLEIVRTQNVFDSTFTGGVYVG